MQALPVHYKGWNRCYRLANNQVDLIVTGDVGPRIIRFGFIGQPNEFNEFEEEVGKIGGEEWRCYGGHRLWHAPEELPRTYSPDNSAVEVAVRENCLHVIQPVEADTSIQKELEITLDDLTSHARVHHRLTNKGLWPVELAVWCLSVMAPGGTAILPLPPRAAHAPENLKAASSLALWTYTDLADPRFVIGKRFILLRQEPGNLAPQKIGLSRPDGWAAYARNGHLFIKRFPYQPGAKYPDLGSSCEAWTDADMLELETLGPLNLLEPGAHTDFVEDWYLLDHVDTPHNDSDVIRSVLPAVARIR